MQLRIWTGLVALGTLVACGDRTPPLGDGGTHTITEADIAALPVDTTAPGTLLCTAIGSDDCPLAPPVANRLADGRLAIWTPGFTVRIWGAGDTIGAPIGQASPRGPYLRAIAVTDAGRDAFQLVTLDNTWRLLTIDQRGAVRDSVSIPDPGTLAAIGFVGRQAVKQQMSGWESDTAGRFTLTLLNRITDRDGRVILDVPVRWLAGGNANGPPVRPLIAPSPSWALGPDGSLTWSPGDRMLIEHRAPNGEVRWRLEGPDGLRVTDRHLTIQDSLVRIASMGLPYEEEQFAAMRERSDTLLPTVGGLLLATDGSILVARGTIPGATHTEYLRLAPDGTPRSRFTLDRRIRILASEGDSLLVHTPTEGEPWELRWLRLQGGK